MLSQRIALLATHRHRELPGLGQDSEHDELLTEAVVRMRSNHEQLRDDWQRGILEQGWREDDRLVKLDERIDAFLLIATRFASRPSTPQAGRDAAALHAEALGDFLPQLDAVVSRYQQIADDTARQALWRERIQLSIGLAVLLAELLFIFRPMVAATVASVQQLQRSNGRLRDVGYRLSHDLRAPVASSLGLVSLATESLDESDVPEARYAIREIGRSLEGLDRHIAEMNRVIMHPQVAARIETLDIAAQLQGIVDTLSHMPDVERLRIRADAPESPQWTGERAVLQSILENLLSNAIKYADPHADPSWIDIAARRRATGVCIDVTDNGLGVPPEGRERLFERHERCHHAHAPGSGLGLYLAREAAERLGGALEYAPTPDGSRFRLTVPDDTPSSHLPEHPLPT